MGYLEVEWSLHALSYLQLQTVLHLVCIHRPQTAHGRKGILSCCYLSGCCGLHIFEMIELRLSISLRIGRLWHYNHMNSSFGKQLIPKLVFLVIDVFEQFLVLLIQGYQKKCLVSGPTVSFFLQDFDILLRSAETFVLRVRHCFRCTKTALSVTSLFWIIPNILPVGAECLEYNPLIPELEYGSIEQIEDVIPVIPIPE